MALPYDRPILAKLLAESPEWQLRYPGESSSNEGRFDEGEGHSFDRMVKSALIDRHCQTAGVEVSTARAWYYERLTELGWTEHREGSNHRMERHDVESFSVSSPLESLPGLGNAILRSRRISGASFQAEPVRGSYDVRYEVRSLG